MQVSGDGGIRIDVDIAGSGEQSVVLLAGFPLSRKIWDETAQQLATAHRVVRPDLRGMGSSAVSDGPYLMESLAGDVAAVLDALGIQHATLVGHSLGGYVALAFARMFTERLDALALVCSRLSADTPAQAKDRERLAERLLLEGESDSLVSAYAARLLSSETKERRPEIFERVSEIIRGIDPRGAAAMLRGMAARSASDDIAPEIGVPVLVLSGALDAVVTLDEARSTASAFPRGTLVIARHSGHLPMIEEPSFTAAALEEWIGKITPASESGS